MAKVPVNRNTKYYYVISNEILCRHKPIEGITPISEDKAKVLLDMYKVLPIGKKMQINSEGEYTLIDINEPEELIGYAINELAWVESEFNLVKDEYFNVALGIPIALRVLDNVELLKTYGLHLLRYRKGLIAAIKGNTFSLANAQSRPNILDSDLQTLRTEKGL